MPDPFILHFSDYDIVLNHEILCDFSSLKKLFVWEGLGGLYTSMYVVVCTPCVEDRDGHWVSPVAPHFVLSLNLYPPPCAGVTGTRLSFCSGAVSELSLHVCILATFPTEPLLQSHDWNWNLIINVLNLLVSLLLHLCISPLPYFRFHSNFGGLGFMLVRVIYLYKALHHEWWC